MNQETILSYTTRIAKRLSRNLQFDIYDKDDIHQEIFLLLLQAEKEYDPAKGDEYTFCFNFVQRRLLNLIRDKYTVNPAKKAIADAVSLEIDIPIDEGNYIIDYVTIIDSRIAAEFRADYLKFRDGVKIPHRRKVMLIEHIKEIVERARKNEEA